MQIRITNVYKLQELSDEAFRRAIDNNRDINTDHDWWWPIYEGATERLEKMGFNGPKINFTGFYSQGDGASFTCNSIDLYAFFDNCLSTEQQQHYKSLCEFFGDVIASIIRTGAHYVHEYTIRSSISEYVSHYDENQEKIEALWAELEELLTEVARAESKKTYKDLERYYEDLTTEDAIADTLEANDCEFTIDGDIFIQK